MKLGQLNDDEIGIYKGTEYEEIGGSRGNGNGGTISVPFTSLAPKSMLHRANFLWDLLSPVLTLMAAPGVLLQTETLSSQLTL